jgi:SAM-dependent methyltransferase
VKAFRCWVCSGEQLALAKASNLSRPLDARSFAITNSEYGVTTAVYRCGQCGFMQCPEVPDALPYYGDLVDPSYEESRPTREIQERKLLEAVRRYKAGGRLLDVGAASGMLVEQAQRMGFSAEGVEPSRWLAEKARERGLTVHLGTLPHADIRGRFDVVTMVDVIEHVCDPAALVASARAVLAGDGVLAVVTPDSASLAARLMGWKWWHYRVAHIGYFNLHNLDRLFASAGFRRVGWTRPGWYFPLDYLAARLRRYLPLPRALTPRFLARITLPLNLRDSILAFYVAGGRA